MCNRGELYATFTYREAGGGPRGSDLARIEVVVMRAGYSPRTVHALWPRESQKGCLLDLGRMAVGRPAEVRSAVLHRTHPKIWGLAS